MRGNTQGLVEKIDVQGGVDGATVMHGAPIMTGKQPPFVSKRGKENSATNLA
jgi:hypothetical protein